MDAKGIAPHLAWLDHSGCFCFFPFSLSLIWLQHCPLTGKSQLFLYKERADGPGLVLGQVATEWQAFP